MLSPIAESNRLFLESIVPVLADSANVQTRAAAVEAVRAGLLFEHVQTQLIAVMDQMNSDNTARLVTAAELAQAWGYLALSLRDETNRLRELVIDIAA
ncbi:hypothetical protein [Roseivivax halodurans]|nr:hypothetical protein [Roseivivax halodurans]